MKRISNDPDLDDAIKEFLAACESFQAATANMADITGLPWFDDKTCPASVMSNRSLSRLGDALRGICIAANSNMMAIDFRLAVRSHVLCEKKQRANEADEEDKNTN